MSDIKKNLILSAKLDASGIGPELKKLKKEFSSGFSLDQAAFTQFKTEFQKIAEAFGNNLKEALKGVKADRGTSGIGGKPTSKQAQENAAWQQHAKDQRTEATKQQQIDKMHEAREKSKETQVQKIRNAGFSQAEREAAQKAREYKTDKFYANKGNQRADIEQPREQKALAERMKIEKKAAEIRKRSLKDWGAEYLKWIKTGNTEALTGKKDGGPGSNSSGIFNKGLSRMGGMKGGMGMLARGGLAAGAAAGVVGAVGVAANAAIDKSLSSAQYGRETRQELASKQFEVAEGVTSGDVYGTAIRQKRRKEGLTGLNRFAAGAKGVMSDVWNARFGKDFGKGIDAKISEQERLEGDASISEVSPLRSAINNSVTPRMGSRASAMEGGMSSGDLTRRAAEGAGYGFDQDEVLSQIQSVKSILGSDELSGARGQANMGIMSDRSRRYGVDFSTQAQAGETFQSFSGEGMNATSGLRMQADLLRKGVAAGLDASKTSKFLETTSDYVASAGMANVDLKDITDSLAGMTKGFAQAGGRDQATNGDIARARQAQEVLKRESLSEGGISGVGNVAGILDSAKKAGIELSAGEFMSLQNTSADADKSSIMETLSENKGSDSNKSKMAEMLMKIKDNQFDYGASTVGLSKSMKTAFRGKESGLTTEATQNLQKVTDSRGRMVDGINKDAETISDPKGAIGSGELKNLANQATVDLVNFSAGFKELGTINKMYGDQIKELTSALEQATGRASEFLQDSAARTAPASKPAHNRSSEDAARSIRSGATPLNGAF